MKKLALLVVMVASLWCCGFTVDEIKELRHLGFSHEQIIELSRAKSSVQVVTASGSASETAQLSTIQAKLTDLASQNHGLVVVCASKEWAARGPGYISLRVKYPTGTWGGLGRVNLIEYVMDGKVTPPVYEEKESCDPGNSSVIVTRQFPIITSRYSGEFVLGAGVYEFELERAFKMSENETSSGGKMKRHKKFFQVEVKPGMATILSYFWEENQRFGLDYVMSHSHLAFVERVAAGYGSLLHTVKVQHNK
jgi:hypothetical protein